jgi:hypothetical protein
MKNEKSVAALITILVAGFVSTVLCSVWTGYVLSTLWAWFIVASFGVPMISVPVAMGINLIARLLTYKIPEEGDESEYSYKVILAFMIPTVFLGVGYVIHLFV